MKNTSNEEQNSSSESGKVGKTANLTVTPRYYMRSHSACDYSVFERGRTNDFGEPYCVLPHVTFYEAEQFIKNQSAPKPKEA